MGLGRALRGQAALLPGAPHAMLARRQSRPPGVFVRIGMLVGLLAAALVLASCAHRDRNAPLAAENFRRDYGYRKAALHGERLPRHHIVMTASGGGTRAAALAQGVLRELAATPIDAAGRTMADEIDLISSVSGGSVTAANFALYGKEGLPAYEASFLRRNLMADLIGGVINPVNWLRFGLTSDSRIDLLVELLDETVFHGATYADLIRRGDGPLLILNAADMSSGVRFTFTQSQFDLLCSDLTPLRIAEAVAASAAYPVGLTPITLTNYSPCPFQFSGGDYAGLISRVQSAVGDNIHKDPEDRPDSVPRSDSDTLYVSPQGVEIEQRYVGLREQRWLNLDGEKNYVHLLDGGIADNLGLGEPLELMTAAGQDGSVRAKINRGELDEIVFLVVNARSDPSTDRDRVPDTPGIVSMALASIGAAIDGRSGGLQAQLATLDQLVRGSSEGRLRVRIVPVDFDLIRGERCRAAFANIGTNWNLDDHEIDGLMEMGAAMLRASPAYQELVFMAGGIVAPDPDAAGEPWPGQARARRACERLLYPKRDLGPLRFGNPA